MRLVLAATALLLACNPGPGPRKVTFLGDTLQKDRTWAYQEWLKGMLYVPAGQRGPDARTQLGVLFSSTSAPQYLHDYVIDEYRKSGVLEAWRTVEGPVACKVGTLRDRTFIAVHSCAALENGIKGICIEDDEVIDLKTACPTHDGACLKQLCADRMELVLPALDALRTGPFASLSW